MPKGMYGETFDPIQQETQEMAANFEFMQIKTLKLEYLKPCANKSNSLK